MKSRKGRAIGYYKTRFFAVITSSTVLNLEDVGGMHQIARLVTYPEGCLELVRQNSWVGSVMFGESQMTTLNIWTDFRIGCKRSSGALGVMSSVWAFFGFSMWKKGFRKAAQRAQTVDLRNHKAR